jgi:CheY-like chemotaxis protein
MNNPCIMIVESHSAARILLYHLLKSVFPQCPLIQAASGEKAIEKTIVQAPDIILMDVELPHMDGIEAARKIKVAYPFIKIVMLTIQDEILYQSQTKELSAIDFVVKETLDKKLIPTLTRLMNPVREAIPSAATFAMTPNYSPS